MSDMTLDSPNALPHSLLARTHMYLALRTLTLPWEQAEAQLLGWLDALPDAGHGDGLHMEVSLCVEQQSVRFGADGPVGLLIQPVASYFQRRAAAPEQQSLLATAGPLLRPDRLGFWAEVSPEGGGLGWVLPVSRRLADLVAWAPTASYAEPLLSWAAAHNLVEATAVGRSLDEDAPLAEIRMRAPGEDGGARVASIVELCQALKLPEPGAQDVLAQASGLGLVVRLGRQGVEELSVHLPHPSGAELAALSTATRQRPSQALAEFQRVLGASAPAYADLRVSRDGQRVELVWIPGSDPSPESRAEVEAKVRELIVMDN